MQFRLNPKTIGSLPPGTYSDGNNLYLIVKETGARTFMLRYQWHQYPDMMRRWASLGADLRIRFRRTSVNWDAAGRKLHARSLILTEVGNDQTPRSVTGHANSIDCSPLVEGPECKL